MYLFIIIILSYNSSITDIEPYRNHITFSLTLTHQVRYWQPQTIYIYIYIYIYEKFIVLTSSLGEFIEDQILQYY